MDKYTSNTIDLILKKLQGITDVESYVNNKRKRIELAKLYKELLNLGGGFPRHPKDMTTKISNDLLKDVNNSCSSCLKASAMRAIVKGAIRVIYTYTKILKEFKANSSGESDSISVHDLRPTV